MDINNGLLLQYGQVTTSSDVVVYPIAFMAVAKGLGTMYGNGQAPGIAIHDVTLTGMRAYRGAGFGWGWMVIGY